MAPPPPAAVEPPAEEYVEAPAEQYSEQPAEGEVIAQEDDVMLEVPPPPPEHLAVIPHHEPHHIPRPHMPSMQSLSMRQMAVPPLLVLGLFMIAGGVTKFLVGEDSPIYEYGIWVNIVLLVTGAGFLVVALLNMLAIRSMLAGQRTR